MTDIVMFVMVCAACGVIWLLTWRNSKLEERVDALEAEIFVRNQGWRRDNLVDLCVVREEGRPMSEIENLTAIEWAKCINPKSGFAPLRLIIENSKWLSECTEKITFDECIQRAKDLQGWLTR